MPQPILYFVRHGETDWNRERRLQGQHDIPLNALGRTQAVRCGVLMKELLAKTGVPAPDYDYVSSPLGRARETMELMRGSMGLDPVPYRSVARLRERKFGLW
jgi:broad specificity phosphatase PhoE